MATASPNKRNHLLLYLLVFVAVMMWHKDHITYTSWRAPTHTYVHLWTHATCNAACKVLLLHRRLPNRHKKSTQQSNEQQQQNNNNPSRISVLGNNDDRSLLTANIGGTQNVLFRVTPQCCSLNLCLFVCV